MTLLEKWLEITAPWRAVFPQQRTTLRAVRQGLGALVCVGRRTITRIIWSNGGEQRSWSGEYFLHSRVKWEPQQLFNPILKQSLALCPGRLVGVAVDDTGLHKTGRCIKQAHYQRDALSPPFHPNIVLGLRFMQASLLVPLHKRANTACRALPIHFQECAPLKRPPRKAGKAQWRAYRRAQKKHNLSTQFVSTMGRVRQDLDQAGGKNKILVLSADGSFCNRTVFTAPRDRTEIIARARKNAALCRPAPTGSRRFYGIDKFSPQQVRQDDCIPWKTTRIFYGGKRRAIRYKQLSNILWQGGARRLPLRLFVVAPTAYRKRKSGRLLYRQPAYLLSTDLVHAPRALLQIYFDRWQIEVNHREEKDTLGVGQAQLWNEKAVPKQPVLVVAAYSAMMLAALLTFGHQRDPDVYAKLPRWRRNAKRPSCLDLIALLRREIQQSPHLVEYLGIKTSLAELTKACAA